MTLRRLDQPEPDWPFKFVGRAAGGFLNEKTLRAKVLRRVSENLSGMLYQLFSSFLRGASCPKSPRAPPLPATLFMHLTGRDVKAQKKPPMGQFGITRTFLHVPVVSRLDSLGRKVDHFRYNSCGGGR